MAADKWVLGYRRHRTEADCSDQGGRRPVSLPEPQEPVLTGPAAVPALRHPERLVRPEGDHRIRVVARQGRAQGGMKRAIGTARFSMLPTTAAQQSAAMQHAEGIPGLPPRSSSDQLESVGMHDYMHEISDFRNLPHNSVTLT